MLKIILIVVVLLIVAAVLYAQSRPSTFHVQRTVNIKAAPEKIFPLVNDLHNWAGWSPYEKLDPAMKKTFAGAANGKGALYSWDGNMKAGAGTVEIVDSQPSSRVGISLRMLKPFEGNNDVEFRFEPKPDNTTDVTWAMDGHSIFMTKLMGLFMNMDQMMGGQFETGLGNLKSSVEGQAFSAQSH